jgi:hypothetical protein
MLRAFCFVLALTLCTSASAQTMKNNTTGTAAAPMKEIDLKALGGDKSMQGIVGAGAAQKSVPTGGVAAGATLRPSNTACGRYPYPPCR